MTWVYDPANLSVPRNALRFLLQDTDPDDPLLDDAELDYLLGTPPAVDLTFTALAAVDILMRKFARKVDTTVGSLHIAAQQKFDHYSQLYEDLRVRAAYTTAIPIAPAISYSGKQTNLKDSDRVVPKFTVDTGRNPAAAPGAMSNSIYDRWSLL